jgi:membrane protein YqaA with SNARE-associated domain
MNTTGLWGLFFSSLLAATLLPGGSEALLLYADHKSLASPPMLLLIATLGNTLGGLSSWGIGWWIRQRWPNRKLEKAGHRKALDRIQHHGAPVLLLSWVPIIGDPLCVAAGWARINLFASLLFIALGKGARYALVLMLAA